LKFLTEARHLGARSDGLGAAVRNVIIWRCCNRQGSDTGNANDGEERDNFSEQCGVADRQIVPV